MSDTHKIERLIAELKDETSRWMLEQEGDDGHSEPEGLKVALYIAMKSMPEDFSKADFVTVITMFLGSYQAEQEMPEVFCASIEAMSRISPERMRDRFLIMKDGERVLWTERFGSMIDGETDDDLDGAVEKIKAMMEADKDRLN